MSSTLGRLQVDLEARIAKFEKDMGKAARILQRDLVTAQQRAERAAIRTRKAQEAQFNTVRTGAIRAAQAVTAFFAAHVGMRAIGSLGRMADEYANVQAKLRLVTNGQQQLGETMDRVFGISQRTFTSIDATATLVARTTRALISSGTAADKALSKSLKLSEAINNAFLVSGATNVEAQNAIIQLSQGLAAGALRGEEFNSVAEQGSRITQALSEYLGVSIGELRKMAKEGKLTADVVSGALLASFEKLRAEADQMPLTISRARTQLDNAFTKYVGDADQAYGSSRKVAEGIQFVAKNLDPLVGGFITAAKVAAAYFAVYRVAIPLTTATIALQRKLTQEIIATRLAQEMGITTATSWATRMKAAAGVALAAFTGWQLGSYMRDQFLQVEIAGIAMVSSLMQGWERAKGNARIAALAIEAYFKAAFQAGQNYVASTVGMSADAIEAMDKTGLSAGVVSRMRAAEDRMRATGDAWTEFKVKAAEAAIEAERAAQRIDREFSDLAEAATLARQKGEDLAETLGDLDTDLPDFSPVVKDAKDAADQMQRLLDARAAFQRESDRMQAEFEGPSAVAWFDYKTAVEDAAQALVRGEATVDQFIEREALLNRQLRETNAEIAARRTPVQQMLEDIAFETKLLGLSAEAKQKEIALRQANATAATAEGQAIIAAMDEYLAKQRQAAGQDFFRDQMQGLWNDVATGAKGAREAVDDFFDALRTRAIQALGERLLDQLFGAQGTTQGGAAGSNWASWIGQIFGGSFAGGGKPPVGKASLVGEDGPELFVPDYSGTIIPADDTAAIMGASRGQSAGGDTNIYIQGATSKRSIESIRIQRDREQRRAMREYA